MAGVGDSVWVPLSCILLSPPGPEGQSKSIRRGTRSGSSSRKQAADQGVASHGAGVVRQCWRAKQHPDWPEGRTLGGVGERIHRPG